MTDATRRIRAFIALKIPEVWERSLAALQGNLKEKLPSRAFRWVKPEQMHVTMRFLGSITHGEATELKQLLHSISAAPFTLRPGGMGCFPNSRRPRVLWAGLTGALEAVSHLHSAVTGATRAIGQTPEDRPFRPHLTLARIHEADRASLSVLEAIIEPIDAWSAEEWLVSELHLLQSHLSSEGARYETLATARLEMK